VLSAASSVLATISGARRAALRDSLSPAARAALDRYVHQEDKIEARWRIWRVAGIAATAVLSCGLLGTSFPTALTWAASVLVAVVVYALPAELVRGWLAARAPVAVQLVRRLRPLEWLAAPL